MSRSQKSWKNESGQVLEGNLRKNKKWLGIHEHPRFEMVALPAMGPKAENQVGTTKVQNLVGN